MSKDPIIEELRQIRNRIEAACQNDPQRLYEYLYQMQEKYRSRLVRRKPKPALIPTSQGNKVSCG